MAQPDCPHCGGTGWKTVERIAEDEKPKRVSWEKPVADTGEKRSVWAVLCDCTGGDRAARTLARARIPKKYEHCDFDNFETDVYVVTGRYKSDEAAAYDRSLEKAKLVVEAFARDYPVGAEAGLLIMGPFGTGKTHLAIAALRKLIGRGHSGLFYNYGELLRAIQDSYNPNSQTTEMGILKPILESEVLVIDDLGFIKPSDWVREMVAHILNSRYNAQLTTILTTMYKDEEASAPQANGGGPSEGPTRSFSRANRGTFKLPSAQEISSQELDTLEKRTGKHIRSRLYEMCRTIELFAPDYRLAFREAGRVR